MTKTDNMKDVLLKNNPLNFIVSTFCNYFQTKTSFSPDKSLLMADPRQKNNDNVRHMNGENLDLTD